MWNMVLLHMNPHTHAVQKNTVPTGSQNAMVASTFKCNLISEKMGVKKAASHGLAKQNSIICIKWHTTMCGLCVCTLKHSKRSLQ